MAIIHRRVFFGKVGSGEPLTQHLKDGEKALNEYGVHFHSRILTDYLSGRSDRVALEWEINDIGEIDAAFSEALANPQAQAFFGTWLKQLEELIHYSEAENWTVR